MKWNNLLLKKEGNVGILSINRPSALNALNLELLSELDEAIDLVSSDPEIYVLIITGEGRAFVAGADITEMKDLDATKSREFAQKGHGVFRKLELMEKPTIAAVNGYALGGGCELAMACDIRIASDKAKFGQPETGLGITPGFGGTQRLARITGLGIAKELIFSCDIIGAEPARSIGLVNHVVEAENLMEKVMELSNKIASKAQIAIRNAKTAINRGIETDFDTSIEIEKNLFALCFSTEDQKEGMAAFLEKREPNYKLR